MINLRKLRAGACSTGLVAAALFLGDPAARADVTLVEDTTLNAFILKMHMNVTERTTRDKQRRDSDGKMDGMLSLLGPTRSGDIIRLDRDLEWRLEPDKKKYQETLFPTPEQRALAQQKMQEMLEKMKQCPAGPSQRPQPASDQGCEKTEPKFDIQNTGDTAVIAGHSAKKTVLSMTYSCKDVKTGDTCDFVVSSESWLSQDTVEGYDERRAFEQAHMKKLGLDEFSGAVKGQMQMALAPYMDQLKQIAAHAGDLKGTPLRTLFSVSVGGPQCSRAKNSGSVDSAGGSTVGDAGAAAAQSATSSTTSAATSTAESRAGQAAGNGIAGQVLGGAAGAFDGVGRTDEQEKRLEARDAGGCARNRQHVEHGDGLKLANRGQVDIDRRHRFERVRSAARVDQDRAQGQRGEGISVS
jgi:hypothetical protein